MVLQAEEVAKSFYQAMKGLGTDEARIIRELCSHNNFERQEIKKRYITMYGHSLEEDLKRELSGHFLETCLALLVPSYEFEAHCVRNALKGWSTNNRVIIEALCTKDSDEIFKLKETYNRIFERDLEKDIEKEESGYLGRILRSLVAGGREKTADINLELAKAEAKELYEAGEGRMGTDEIVFIRIFCTRSYQQLVAIFNAYEQLCQHDIEKAVKAEMSGNLERALLALVKSIRNKPGYYAELLHEAMKGIGTRDSDLIRIMVLRSEIDLPIIKTEYERMYGKSLHDAFKSEISGNYQKILLTLLGKDIQG